MSAVMMKRLQAARKQMLCLRPGSPCESESESAFVDHNGLVIRNVVGAQVIS